MRAGFNLSILAAAVLALTGCGGGKGNSSSTFTGTLDSTGTWRGTYQISGDSSEHSFTAQVTQTGGSVSGKISIPLIGMSDASLTGTVTGGSITFGDINKIVSFSGNADVDDTASGEYSITYSGQTFRGTWTAFCVRAPVLQRTISLPSGTSSYHGLVWDGSGFWLSDGQLVEKLNVDGTVATQYMYNSASLPYHSFDGLAFDGTSLWAIEDGVGSSYNQAQICSINPADGGITTTIPAPPDGSSPGIAGSIGLGLAWDGSSLWCYRNSITGTQTIYKINRSNGAALGSIPGPSGVDSTMLMPGGFGAAGTDLWLSDRIGYLYKVRSSDGHLMRRFDYSSAVAADGTFAHEPGGITSDGTLLWVRDSIAGKLYGFALPTGLMP